MTVTKQQQLEWLVNKADVWGDDRTAGYMMSRDEVGFVVGLLTRLSGIELLSRHSHIITREEWKQERDKMQKHDGSSVMTEEAKELEKMYLRINVYGRMPNKSWHDRGEFPHAGCECEVKEDDGEWYKTHIVGFDDDGYCVYTTPWNSLARNYDGDGCKLNFRPLRTEREKAIDAACKAIGGVGEDGLLIIERIYDAGLLK